MNDKKNLKPDEGELKRRLQGAVRGVEPPPFLAARIRARVRESAKPAPVWYRRPWLVRMSAAAATAIVAIGISVPYLLRGSAEEESFLAAALDQVSSLIGVGLGDHIHCTLFTFPEGFPGGNQPGRTLDPEYQPVKQIMAEHAPSGYELSLAHHCRFHLRRFTHVTLKNEDSLLSLVITEKGGGEAFSTGQLQAALAQEGLSFYQESAGALQVAAFETEGHLVYAVSDMTREQNTQLLLAMASQIRAVLTQVEL